MPLLTFPWPQILSAGGSTYPGAKLFFYETGTSTLATTYTDAALTTPHTNPVIADATGVFPPIYLANKRYKAVLKTAGDVTLFTADPVMGGGDNTVATIADMTAIDSPTNGSSVIVVDADRGGVFVFDTNATSAADNGTTFKADDATSGSWVRQYAGAVKAEWFGAVGDNSTNDTAALQAAIDAGAGAIHLTAGKTYLTDGLTLVAGTRIIGYGAKVKQRSAGITILSGDTVNDIHIEGVEFDGGSLGTFANGVTHGWNGGDKCMYFISCQRVKILNNYIHDFTNIGFVFDTPETADPDNADIWIEGNTITGIGARLTGVNTPAYTIQPGEGIAVAIGDSSNRDAPKNKRVVIRENSISNNFQTQISVTETDGIVIEGNHCRDSDSNNIQCGTGTINASIIGNHCSDSTARRNPTTEGRGISVHADGDEGQYLIVGNVVKNAGLYGIDCRAANQIVSNNIVIGTGSNNSTAAEETITGIVILESQVFVQNNVVHNTQGRGIMAFANSSSLNNISILHNRVSGSTDSGVVATRDGSSSQFFNRLTISGNVVEDTDEDGITVNYANDSLLTGNVIDSYDTLNNSRYGLNLLNSTGVVVDSNVVKNGAATSTDLRVDSTCAEIRVGNNNIFSSAAVNGNDTNLKLISGATTLTPSECYSGVVVRATNGTHTLTLPSGHPGMSFTALASGESPTAIMQIDPAGTEKFLGQADGKYLQLDAGESAIVSCVSAGIWAAFPSDGTSVSYEA